MMVGTVAWKLAQGSADFFWARGDRGVGGWCLFVSGLFFSLQEHRSGEAALLCLGCTLDGALVHLVLLGEDLETGQECPPWTGCAGAGEELLPAPPVGL